MLAIKGLTKKFGTRFISNNLNLTINKGEFVTIIGRSGEGKSVLLKQLVGLIQPDGGSVLLNDHEIISPTFVDRQALSKFGYVFQFAALLDSLTVFENVGIALLEDGFAPSIVRPQVIEKLASVGLDAEILSRYPDELSGGMRKRVGLARTLMSNPEIILYDEPTTGLDPISTQLIHHLMRSTHEKFNATTIVISHDTTIFEYSDTVAMLFEGTIVHKEPAKNIWHTENPYIHQFIRGLSKGPLSDPRKD